MKRLKQMLAQRQAISWLARLQAGEPNDKEKAKFLSWLNKSSINQAAYIQAESLWQQGEILDQLDETPIANSNTTASFHPYFWGFSGFSVALSVFLFFLFFSSLNSESVHSTGYEQKKVTLKDGSVITLDPNSQLSVNYNRSLRLVTLEYGRVYFDVATEHSRPFEVDLESGRIRVLGTEFSVEKLSYSNSLDTKITVVEGKVGVVANNVKNSIKTPRDDYILTKNEQTTLNEVRLGISPRSVNSKIETAWEQGKLIYRGAPLKKVIRDLEYYYQVSIQISDESLKNSKLHATLGIEDINSSLQIVAHALDIELTKNVNPRSYTLKSK